jgi:L-lactate dehydrogenase complex protein LldF
MTDTFHAKIRTAIADENLQTALDRNAETRRDAGGKAYASLTEDLQNLRQRAHAVRAGVIADHDRYLEEFTANAQLNGFIVHHAADAAQARQVVLEIAKKHHARLIAKSKTMVSEEIELNHALEAAGIRPVETDLGEFIVQLREESPSHIVAPAIHLRREDVGETFHKKLGIPLTYDISTLTNAARATLRETFLNADIGLSGVNFGVAESGAIALVTNEGNGRMVTTLPKVHIALMGIERLVPSYDDLALMLTLLPRAATGQQMSVYMQIIQGPRRDGEMDGAVERHIVLVDNGRSGLRGTPLNDTLFCIRCGACLNSCPVFREIGGHTYTSVHGDYTPYPGPIGSALSPALFDQEEFGHLAQASTLCGACKEACPMDIDLPTMLLRVRGGGMKLDQALDGSRRPQGIPQPVSWGLRFFTWFASSPGRFAFAQKLAASFSRIWSPRSEWMGLPAYTGWGYSKDFPRPAFKTFRDRWRSTDLGTGFRDQTAQLPKYDEPDTAPPIFPLSETTFSDQALSNERVIRFQAELEMLGGKVIRCSDHDLAAQITALLKEKDVRQVMVWADVQMPAGFVDALREQEIDVQHEPDPKIRVGITGSTAGIADTGTLVITSGHGKPQFTSLLPETHIAILRETDIKQNLAEVLGFREVRDAAAVSLISGPSRTGDIEMTLTVGVHGPGEVIVFLTG